MVRAECSLIFLSIGRGWPSRPGPRTRNPFIPPPRTAGGNAQQTPPLIELRVRQHWEIFEIWKFISTSNGFMLSNFLEFGSYWIKISQFSKNASRTEVFLRTRGFYSEIGSAFSAQHGIDTGRRLSVPRLGIITGDRSRYISVVELTLL